jgi:hypothetical protein
MPVLAAAEATPQGAADLTALFRTYLGAVPGVVAVATDGDGYAVTLDAAPLIALLPAEAGAAATVSPYRMRGTDNGDGTWSTSDDQPIRIEVAVPGLIEMRIATDRVAGEGLWDTALLFYRESACVVEGLEVFEVVHDPVQGRSETVQRIASMAWDVTGAAGGTNGLDVDLVHASEGIAQAMDLPLAPDMPPMQVEIMIDGYEADASVTGLRTGALLGGLAWFVASPDPAMMPADRAAMKAILTDGLPIWEHLVATLTGSGLCVRTPVGPATADLFGVDVELSGAVPGGRFRLAFRLEGVVPPPGIVPPFLEPLLPTHAGIDVQVEGFDAAGPAQLLLGLFDLPPGGDPGPEFEGRFLAALLPGGTVTVSLPTGEIANDTNAIAWEGSMVVGPEALPAGSARIAATGYDGALALIEGLPPAMKAEALPALLFLRGLARVADDGTLVWEVEATGEGKLTVNGMDLSSLK